MEIIHRLGSLAERLLPRLSAGWQAGPATAPAEEATIPRDGLPAACRTPRRSSIPSRKPTFSRPRANWSMPWSGWMAGWARPAPTATPGGSISNSRTLQEALRTDNPQGDLLARDFRPLRRRPRRLGVGLVPRRATGPAQLPGHARRGRTIRRSARDFEDELDKLADALDAYLAKPTTDNALAISESVRWLQGRTAGPGTGPRDRVRTACNRTCAPKFRPRWSGRELPSALTTGCRSRTASSAPQSHGTAHTVGQTCAELRAQPRLRRDRHALLRRDHRQQRRLPPPGDDLQLRRPPDLAARKRLWVSAGRTGLASRDRQRR